MKSRAERLTALQRDIARLDRHLNGLQATSTQLMRLRMLAFGAALMVGLVGLALGPGLGLGNWLGLLALSVMLIPFAFLVVRYRRVDATIIRFRAAARLKRTHLARMALDWRQLPERDIRIPPDHPFALDLDIIGPYSVHRLLDSAVTRGGSERLSEWLLAQNPDLERIGLNQARVAELIRLTPFRDRLALEGMVTAGQHDAAWDDRPLLRWLEQPGAIQPIAPQVLTGLLGLAILNAALFILYTVGSLPPWWIVSFGLYAALTMLLLRNAGRLFQEGLALLERLRRLEGVLVRLENYGFLRQPALRELCSPLLSNHQRPSEQIRRARWIASAASLQQNPVVWLIVNALLPWDLWVAKRLAQTRDELRIILPGWLDIWYELEALSSLATFAVLNPGTSFPQVDPAALFGARGLGHPLIPAEERVTNDFVINELGSTTIITGSNMSGKSSFLRTMGINLRLAYCGSVICASQMQVGLFRVFTSIRISDSVVDGFSYFYAEVRRLKSLLDALEQVDEPPLFYLIDEIFRGTNNRERLAGSQAYIKALAGRHGVGFIATHDLELVKLEAHFEQVQNYHFREAVIEGKMVFDYRLRPGPCPTTNALKIMALVGLPVDGEDQTDGGV